MSVKISDIYTVFKDVFPMHLAESFDNCGFLFGNEDNVCNKVVISLDITEAVIYEAELLGAQLIISHHPLFFKEKLSAITSNSVCGRKILSLASKNISAICMHTNADSADGGVNDVLAKACGLINIQDLGAGESLKLGRIGMTERPYSIDDYAAFVKKALSANGVKFLDAGNLVTKVAVGGGSCGDFISVAKSMGADTFITADVKYHQFQQALEQKINIIDAGHFATENLICERFKSIINECFPTIEATISKSNKDFVRFC